MKLFRAVVVLAVNLLVFGTGTASKAEVSYCTGTYGGGDYTTTYVRHGSPEISTILTVPSIHGRVENVLDDTIVLNVGRKDGVNIGDKFRIERPTAISEAAGDRATNCAIGEIAITRVDETGCAGMLLGDNPVKTGDVAVSTKRGSRIVPSNYDIPPVLAYGNRIPVIPSTHRIPVVPNNTDHNPPSTVARTPYVPRFVPDSTSAFSGDYLNEIPRARLDIWAAGHSPLKVCIASADLVRGYRPVFGDFARQAFAEWTKASNGALQFEYVDDANKADIEVKWTFERSDLPKNELGITHTVRSDEGIEKAEVRLLTSGTERGISVKDSAMWITTLHEVGHALGLSHSSNKHDVMTPMLSLDQNGECSMNSLTDRDINSIARLYGDSDIHNELLKRHERAIASRGSDGDESATENN